MKRQMSVIMISSLYERWYANSYIRIEYINLCPWPWMYEWFFLRCTREMTRTAVRQMANAIFWHYQSNLRYFMNVFAWLYNILHHMVNGNVFFFCMSVCEEKLKRWRVYAWPSSKCVVIRGVTTYPCISSVYE